MQLVEINFPFAVIKMGFMEYQCNNNNREQNIKNLTKLNVVPIAL